MKNELIRKPYGFKYDMGQQVEGGVIVDRVRQVRKADGVTVWTYGVEENGNRVYILQEDIKEKQEEKQEGTDGMEIIDQFLEEWKKEYIEYHLKIKKMKYNDSLELLSNKRITKKAFRLALHNDIERIKEVAEHEAELKKAKFIQQIQGKVGNILEASLRMNPKEGIDGTVRGEKATATIRTVLAGGFNVQRLHYRTIVKVKK